MGDFQNQNYDEKPEEPEEEEPYDFRKQFYAGEDYNPPKQSKPINDGTHAFETYEHDYQEERQDEYQEEDETDRLNQQILEEVKHHNEMISQKEEIKSHKHFIRDGEHIEIASDKEELKEGVNVLTGILKIILVAD